MDLIISYILMPVTKVGELTIGLTPTGGRWDESEPDYINILELRAILVALKSYFNKHSYQHIRIKSSKSTAISYISNAGGTKCKTCNDIAKDVWLLCIKHNVWISAAYIPGTHNVIADQKSRKFDDNKEWQLYTLVYCKVVDNFSLNQILTFLPPDLTNMYLGSLIQDQAIDALTLS